MSWLALLLAGCPRPAPVAEDAPDTTPHATAVEEQHGEHATVTHRFEDPERWSAVFDAPERDFWQMPNEVISAMGLAPGMAVADIGAGTGYFMPHLAAAVGAEGRVIAIDIEPTLVEHMTARAKEHGWAQVEARLAAPDDPRLEPGEVDRILIVNTYHHVDDRVAYFRALRDALRPDGRLVVVDYKLEDTPHGPPLDHRLDPAVVVQELSTAGWTLVRDPDVLPEQYVQVYALR